MSVGIDSDTRFVARFEGDGRMVINALMGDSDGTIIGAIHLWDGDQEHVIGTEITEPLVEPLNKPVVSLQFVNPKSIKVLRKVLKLLQKELEAKLDGGSNEATPEVCEADQPVNDIITDEEHNQWWEGVIRDAQKYRPGHVPCYTWETIQ